MGRKLGLICAAMAFIAMPLCSQAQSYEDASAEIRALLAEDVGSTDDAQGQALVKVAEALERISDKIDLQNDRIARLESKDGTPTKLTPVKSTTAPAVSFPVSYSVLQSGDACASPVGFTSSFGASGGCGSLGSYSAQSCGAVGASFAPYSSGCSQAVGFSGSGCSFGASSGCSTAQSSGCSTAQSSGCSYGASSGCSTAGSYRARSSGGWRPFGGLFRRSSGGC